jgi:antitoxin component YwqK of YwqJK toxin-antitoxin module
MFYTNGYRAATGTYLHREKEGKWQYYSFYTRDYIVLEEAYKNGLRNGVCRKFHANGQTAEILHWKAGIKEGKWQQYSLEGILLLEANYRQGKLHGAYLVNYNNGAIHVKGQYKEDMRDGEWIFRDETGKTTQNLHFNRGIADNQASLDRQHQLLLDQLDSMKGKIKDPTLDEIRW